MKCIWRIILGVLTAGISEVLRHKSHDKTLPCPDIKNGLMYVEVKELAPGDFFVANGYSYQLVELTDKAHVRLVATGDDHLIPLNSIVFKIL